MMPVSFEWIVDIMLVASKNSKSSMEALKEFGQVLFPVVGGNSLIPGRVLGGDRTPLIIQVSVGFETLSTALAGFGRFIYLPSMIFVELQRAHQLHAHYPFSKGFNFNNLGIMQTNFSKQHEKRRLEMTHVLQMFNGLRIQLSTIFSQAAKQQADSLEEQMREDIKKIATFDSSPEATENSFSVEEEDYSYKLNGVIIFEGENRDEGHFLFSEYTLTETFFTVSRSLTNFIFVELTISV
ncbi:CACTA en-spm transposon protein [Caenorhabditis elegans]|uniref:CACTA en-spm transposon protein n=1 Tax=Caenorhabditis elegans TaxID=6239 RepID=Q95QG6_CAEEL|nr:CACTA en-spm transposon protein [Caenorhabditis elegans]CCD71105.1 CACTA en-spm transposon protein [Caenorhabditis elegans]|eukprot:NP_500796.1 Uncharacterized protein CELE_F41H10.12 [Caenorhabditis elegans]